MHSFDLFISLSYTKMGYSGNVEPQYIVPTVIACKADEGGIQGKRDGVEDLDYYIGDAAFANSTTHQINYPIRHGLIDNWDNMVFCSQKQQNNPIIFNLWLQYIY
jgi:actin-related protein